MSMAYEIRSFMRQPHERRKPIKCTLYLRFVRSLPCCACGGTRNIEAMHIGPRGLGQKVDDKSTLPGCRWCHEELHQVGRWRSKEKYQIDFQRLILKYTDFFESNQRGTW